MILSFEHRYSRFREDSLVYHYNQSHILPDDADFLRMLAIGEKYRELTDGYFSLRVGGYLEELGYGKQQILHRKRSPSFDKDEQKLLDLWWIGKGYLIDMIAQYIQSQGISRYMINGGGDILISQERIEDFGKIGLQDPSHPEQIFAEVSILQGALAWSGIQHRKRNTSTGQQHHLINPKTWKPVDNGILSLFIRHQSIIVADIMATALFVMPIDQIESTAMRVGVDFCIVFEDRTSVQSRGF